MVAFFASLLTDDMEFSVSTSIEVDFPGVTEAYNHFQAAGSTDFFLCINTARIPLRHFKYPEDFLYSTSGATVSSRFYSVEANCSMGMWGPNAFSQNVLTELLQTPDRRDNAWRHALARVPMFSRVRKCEGLVDQHLAFEAVLKECPWLENEVSIRDPFSRTAPYLGIYAPSPTQGSGGGTAAPVQMPSFDLHFPVTISKTVSIQQFAAFWNAIRTQFAQKTAAALNITPNVSGHEYSVVFFGPPEQTTKSTGCMRHCAALHAACETVDCMTEAAPAFSIGRLRKWRIRPISSRFEFSAIWRSIAVLAEPDALNRLEPMVLSLSGATAHPKSLRDFWRDRWISHLAGQTSSPGGCTFARPTLPAEGSSIAAIDVYISGDASDFFRLLFQPIICRREQIRYGGHSRTADTIEITVDIPPNTPEPSRRTKKMASNGWEHFEVPENFQTDIHPASRMTPSEWEQLFTDTEKGIVFRA